MGSTERAVIADDATFQKRVRMVLFYNAATVLAAAPNTYSATHLAVAKKVVNGLIPIENFCRLLLMDATLGPLADSAATQAALTDGQINAALPATVSILVAAQI